MTFLPRAAHATCSQEPPTTDSRALLLVVHGSAELYGSDKVLLNVIGAMVRDAVLRPVVLLHEDGPLVAALRDVGVEVHVGRVAKISRALFGPLMFLHLWRELKSAVTALDQVVSGRRVGLVYSNTLAVLGGAYWARRRGLSHLWHVHEIILRPALVRKGLPWLAQRFSQRVISNSQPTQDWLLSQAPGLAGRAEVVFNGLPTPPPRDAAATAAFRNALGLQADEVLVTLAGRLNHWKGQDLLIDAAALLQRQGRLGRLHFAIVGDVFAGHEDIRRLLLQQVAQHGLQHCVHFVPFRAEIYPVWWASDIAVVPSLEPEPFGMVAIEAMACSLPVVAAGHGGLLDIVVDGVTGLLFRPRDATSLSEALFRLGADEPLRRGMGAKGAARQLAHFSLQTQVERTRDVCLQMIRQP